MKINGIEVDFKISRLKDAAAFELALSEMGETEMKHKKEVGKVPLTEVLTKMIQMFRCFFVTATEVDVLADCDDLSTAKQTYLDFLNEIQAQKTELLNCFSPDRIK